MTKQLTKKEPCGIELAFLGQHISKMDTYTQASDLSRIVDVICVKVGSENLEDETQKLIIKFIIDQFWFLNVKEIAKAFDMAIARRFNCDPCLYGKFINCEYVGRILSEYVIWRRSTYSDVELKYRNIDEAKKEKKRKEENEKQLKIVEEEINEMITGKYTDKCKYEHYRFIAKNLTGFTKEEIIRAKRKIEKTSKRTGVMAEWEHEHAACEYLAKEWIKSQYK